MGFCDFCCFILCRYENWWDFGVFGGFVASYFVILRVGGIFGIFAASYFVVLRVGVFFLGFLGVLLLHTLSF